MFRVRASWNESAHNLKKWRLANRGLRRETPPDATITSGTFPKSDGYTVFQFRILNVSLVWQLKLLSRVESCKRKLIKVLFHSEQIAFQTKTGFIIPNLVQLDVASARQELDRFIVRHYVRVHSCAACSKDRREKGDDIQWQKLKQSKHSCIREYLNENAYQNSSVWLASGPETAPKLPRSERNIQPRKMRDPGNEVGKYPLPQFDFIMSAVTPHY